ncbi:MAG: Glutaredoxin-related protein [Ignavibacteriae bacterium]|nr:MAG: Glutaredoxin-related protein [Ignavibacteriota bacterium]
MNFLKEKDKQEIIKRFENLKGNVKILFFTQELECQYCRETGQLLKELAELSDKINLETYNFVNDKEVADKYGIDKVPGIVVMGEEIDYGIRYYGIPAGYEFSSLLESIEMISTGDTQLSQDVIEKVKTINEPVHIQVFVTPTCPYCPSAVLMGHALAILNKNIRADMVEATEFPQLAYKYNVRGVPRVVINENHFFEGALPENLYVEEVLHALDHSNHNHN